MSISDHQVTQLHAELQGYKANVAGLSDRIALDTARIHQLESALKRIALRCMSDGTGMVGDILKLVEEVVPL